MKIHYIKKFSRGLVYFFRLLIWGTWRIIWGKAKTLRRFKKRSMQNEKPSFARFSGGMNLSQGNAAPTRSNHQEAGVSRKIHEPDSSSGENASKAARAFDALITVSLVAIFFGLPLFFTGMTYQGPAFEKQLYFYFWLLIGVVSWVSKGVITGEMKIRRTPLDIPIGLFWAFVGLSAIFSVDRWHSFWGFFGDPSRGFISVTALALAYFLIMSHFNRKRFMWMFGSVLASGFLVSIWSVLTLMQVRFLPESIERFAPVSLIGTMTTLGLYLGLLVPLFLTALFLLWKDNSLQKGARYSGTAFAFIGLALILALIFMIYPFVSSLVLLIGLSFFMVYILAQIMRPAEQWVWVPMVVFVVVLAIVMINGKGFAKINFPVEVSPNANLSWQIAKNALKENFLEGVGPANYRHAFSQYRSQEYNLNTLYTIRFDHGKGLIFESLATIGVIGTVLFIVLGLSFLSIGLYLLTHERQRNKLSSLGLWATAVMFFAACVLLPVNGPLLLMGVLLSTLAMAVVLWESGSEERYLQLSFKAAPKFALALAFIFMVVSAGVAFLFVFMGKVFLADIDAGKGIRLSAEGARIEAVARFESAIKKYSLEGRYQTRLGQEYMALTHAEARRGENERNVDALKRYAQQALIKGNEGVVLMPNDVLARESLALLFENASLYDSNMLSSAAEHYKIAQEREPESPLLLLKLGQIKMTEAGLKPEGSERTALYAEAQKYFEQSIEKKRNFAVAHYYLAVVFSRMKETDRAIASMQDALDIDQENLSYQNSLALLYQSRDGEGDLALAENLFKKVLGKNANFIDVRLSLGLLYEAQGKRDAAISEYEKLLTIIPENSQGDVEGTLANVRKLIDNVRRGTGNLGTSGTAVSTPLPAEPGVQETEVTQGPAAPPSEPNESALVVPDGQ